jgi:hypothetical protein
MQPFHHRPVGMTRQNTHGSQYTSFGEASSDSISSMWDREQDLTLGRSSSGSGRMRMTPLFPAEEKEKPVFVSGNRSSSAASSSYRTRSGSITASASGPAPIPTSRPLPRSNLSHTSLAASQSDSDLPPEFGSAPAHTLSLLQSYMMAFPDRTGSSSGSYKQRGFVFPGSASHASASVSSTASYMQRRDSQSASSTSLSRPVDGTIRRKSKNRDGEYASWDAFGKEECKERATRSQRAGSSPLSPTSLLGARALPVPGSRNGSLERDPSAHDTTPKQSLKIQNGQWQIDYRSPSETPATVTAMSASLSKSRTIRARSTSSGQSAESQSQSSELGTSASFSSSRSAAPSRPHLNTSASGSGSTARGTPRVTSVNGMSNPNGNGSKHSLANADMPPPSTIPSRRKSLSRGASAADLDLEPAAASMAKLNIIGNGNVNGNGVDGAHHARGFNWDEYEKQGGKTYALPKGFKVNNKAGLFYFQ